MEFSDQAEIYNETFGPVVPLPPVHALPNITHTINRLDKTVELRFPTNFARGSTVFGGDMSEPVILDARALARLPHDLVLACFDVVSGPQNIAGLTPDMSLDDGQGGTAIIEVGTTSAFNITAIRQTIMNKLGKYRDLYEAEYITAMNVVVVSPRFAHDVSGPLHPESAKALMEAYALGRSIVHAYERIYGAMDLVERDERLSAVKDMINQMARSHQEWDWAGDFSMDPIWESDDLMRIGTRTFEKPIESWDSLYRSWATGTTEQTTVVHLPFISVQQVGKDYPMDFPPHDSMYGKIFEGARGKLDEKAQDYDTLRMLSLMRSGKAQPKEREAEDTYSTQLSLNDRVQLAERGVMAKSLRGDGFPDLAAHFAKTKEPQSIMTPNEDISEYIRSDVEWASSCCWPLDELDDSWLNDETGDLKDFMRVCMRMKESHKLHFLEMVMREVAYNMDRNPHDSGQRKQFIYRRIPGYAAFVVIRTTRMGGSDDAPCFFSVVYKGDASEGKIFEQSIKISEGWHYTRFISLSRRKAENLQGILSQVLGILGYLIDEFLTLCPESSKEQIAVVAPAWRSLYLILLQDKDHTSRNLQQLRYYYMELLSGMPGCVNRSLKAISKFEPILRNRLLVFFVQRLRSIHESLPGDFHKWRQSSSQHQEVQEEEQEAATASGSNPLPDAQHQVLRSPLDTPFGFQITQPSEVLLASYVCMLHNKNEANYGHGAIQVVDKMTTMQLKLRALQSQMRAKGDKLHRITGVNVEPDKLEMFQHSESAVKRGADLALRSIAESNGVPAQGIKDWAMDRALLRALSTVVSELATTKSSTIPFDPNQIITPDGDKIERLGSRRKCIEAVMDMLPELTSHSNAENISVLMNGVLDKEHGGFQVTIFKKNQIGGVREILVLTMRGRMLIRFYSDLFREFCSLHPSEVLTDDASKDKFVAAHFAEVRAGRTKDEFFTTFKVSGDMTKWAPSFTLYEFHSMTKSIFPEYMWPICTMILKLHQDKMVQIPPEAAQMFYDSPETTLSSPGADWLKELFLGVEDDELLNKGSAVMHLKTDMLQGILHYTSSMYHICHLEYFKNFVQSWASAKGVRAVVSFEASSDDEGILISFIGDREIVSRLLGEFRGIYPRMKRSVDALFGITTSFEKTTISWGDWFEFNSKFYMGNTVVSPLIKFVARAMDDNPQESLSRRVSAMYSALRQLREAGASGYLCHWISICQSVAYTSNLGVGTMSWYESGLYSRLTEGLTVLGHYGIQGPLIAGLTNGVYMNWSYAKNSPTRLKYLYHLGSYALPQDLDDLQTTMFGVFPRQKYFKFLERIGLSGMDKSILVTKDNFRDFMFEPTSKYTMELQVQRKALDPTLALSFSWPNRIMAVRMTPYLLWSAMFKVPGSRLDIQSLKEDLLTRPNTMTLHELFPMWRQFQMLDEIRGREFIQIPLSRRRRLHYQWVSPFYLAGEHQAHIKDVIDETWYQRRSKTQSVQRIKAMWEAIKMDVPFMRDEGPEQTLEASPFETYDQLLGFVEAYAESNRPVKLLARGSVDTAGQSILKLARYNVSPMIHFSTSKDVEPSPAEMLMAEVMDVTHASVIDPRLTAIISACEDRLKAWYEVLYQAKESVEILNTECLRDLREFFTTQIRSKNMPIESVRMSSTGSERMDEFKWVFLLFIGIIDLSEAWSKCERLTIWVDPEMFEQGRYKGEYDVIRKRRDLVVRQTFKNREMRVRANRPEKVVRRLMKALAMETIDFAEINVPNGEVVAFRMVKGTRMMVVNCEDNSQLYISAPQAMPRIVDHIRAVRGQWQPGFVEKWLQREPLTDSDFEVMAREIEARGRWASFGACMIRCTAILKNSRIPMQIQERIHSAPVREEDVVINEADLLELASNLRVELEVGEVIGAEDWADIESEFINGSTDFQRADNLGLEAFAVEETYTTFEVNRTLRGLLYRMEVLSGLGEYLMTPAVKLMVALYKVEAV